MFCTCLSLCAHGGGVELGWLPSIHHKLHDPGEGDLYPVGLLREIVCIQEGCLHGGGRGGCPGGSASKGVCIWGAQHPGGLLPGEIYPGVCLEQGGFCIQGRWANPLLELGKWAVCILLECLLVQGPLTLGDNGTQTFDVVIIIVYVIRNGLHGGQCNCLHMMKEKKATHHCRQMRTDPETSQCQ